MPAVGLLPMGGREAVTYGKMPTMETCPLCKRRKGSAISKAYPDRRARDLILFVLGGAKAQVSRRVNKERQCSEKCYLNPEKCLWQKKQKRRVCHSGYVWNATQLDGNSVTGSTFQVPRFLMTDLLGVSLRHLGMVL